jgi:hypothetical protein
MKLIAMLQYHIADIVVSSLLKLKHLVQLEAGFLVGAKNLSEKRYLITRIMEHERLQYLDYATREQWALSFKMALESDDDLQSPYLTVAGLAQSKVFYIDD